jgi:hypothetical protein
MPALAFSLASCPRAGPEVGVLVFLMPALAVDHSEPKASPPVEGLAAGWDFMEDAVEVGFAWGVATGAWTEVK